MATARAVVFPESVASGVRMGTISALTDTPILPVTRSRSSHSQANRILACLEEHHVGSICIPELRLSSGFANESRIDFWAIDPSPANGNPAVAYEIKTSRRDWRKDNAFKQRGARLFADRFFYATQPGLLKPKEIPDWAGLVECESGAYNVIVQAPKLDKQSPSWGLVVSMLRRCPIEVISDQADASRD